MQDSFVGDNATRTYTVSAAWNRVKPVICVNQSTGKTVSNVSRGGFFRNHYDSKVLFKCGDIRLKLTYSRMDGINGFGVGTVDVLTKTPSIPSVGFVVRDSFDERDRKAIRSFDSSTGRFITTYIVKGYFDSSMAKDRSLYLETRLISAAVCNTISF